MTDASRGYLGAAIAAGAVMAIAFGIRQAQPLFISAINSRTAVGYATISLAFGIAQLMWGVGQPIAGAIADRHGTRIVMIGGVLLLSVATVLTPFADSALALIFLIGIVGASGTGALGLAILMSAARSRIPEAKRAFASGVVNAAGSFGQFTLVPFAQLLIGIAGWQPAMMILGATGIVAVPLILWLTQGPPSPVPHPTRGADTLSAAIRDAAGDRSFVLLTLGFFTCGFHVAFIATHLPGIVASCELPPSVGAWSLAIIGLFNIAGSLWAGRAMQAWRLKLILAGVYAARAALIVVFYYSPKTELAFFLFAAGIGFTYLSTVPPTLGLVAKLHGSRYLATLFGIVMLSHQVGGFLGAWLGGKAFEATGSYDWMWWADVALCLMAAAVHLPIREARKLAPAAA
jgi:predicted MFS family arabinose efflux permease